MQHLNPDLLIHILSFTDHNTNKSFKCLNKSFYNFYYTHRYAIIYNQYQLSIYEIQELYDNINNDIQNIIWLKGTKKINSLEFIDLDELGDTVSRTVPELLYEHIFIESVLICKNNTFNSFPIFINCNLDVLVQKLYAFYHILYVLGIDLKLYYITNEGIPHRIDYPSTSIDHPYFDWAQRSFIKSLQFLFKFLS